MSAEPGAAPATREEGAAEAAAEWTRRVAAEYRSAVLAQQVTLWLLKAGGPPDLIRDGLRVVGDELTHSELSWRVAVAAGASEPPVIDPESLEAADAGPLTKTLGLAVARYFCIGETVAVPLFRLLRRQARVAVAQRALDAVLRDEARHRQLGWDVLDWLLTVDDEVAPAIAEWLPEMLADIRVAYAAQPEVTALSPESARWGLASPAAYAEVLEDALEREVLPRFSARQIGPAATGAGPECARPPAVQGSKR